jgi:acyl-CoA hydrolase
MNLSAQEAVKHIKSNDRVFIHSAAAIPQALVKAMSQRKAELKNVQLYQIHTEGHAPYCDEGCEDAFTVNAMFVGPSTRKAVQNKKSSYIPIFLSEAPLLFRRNIIPLDVALISVSPPDKHGFCSLGPSVDISLAAAETAKLIIAQINKNMPRTHGDGVIHISNIDICVECDEALPESTPPPLDATSKAIGHHIAELIDDGSCLQMGIGSIPNAVLSCLGNHKGLGIHSEMFTDGMLPLVEKGVITGEFKKKHPGKIVSSFVIGSRKLYDFIDDNPGVAMLESDYVNNTSVIAKHKNVVAINSAIEIDLSGQVCADSIGGKIYSGVGGQMDFVRGASLSEGGKPIIAIPSVTKNNTSKIVPVLKEGAGVVTTRAHIQYVATEHGIVNLYGKSIEKRAKLLTSIAHPSHREWLEASSKKLFG